MASQSKDNKKTFLKAAAAGLLVGALVAVSLFLSNTVIFQGIGIVSAVAMTSTGFGIVAALTVFLVVVSVALLFNKFQKQKQKAQLGQQQQQQQQQQKTQQEQEHQPQEQSEPKPKPFFSLLKERSEKIDNYIIKITEKISKSNKNSNVHTYAYSADPKTTYHCIATRVNQCNSEDGDGNHLLLTLFDGRVPKIECAGDMLNSIQKPKPEPSETPILVENAFNPLETKKWTARQINEYPSIEQALNDQYHLHNCTIDYAFQQIKNPNYTLNLAGNKKSGMCYIDPHGRTDTVSVNGDSYKRTVELNKNDKSMIRMTVSLKNSKGEVVYSKTLVSSNAFLEADNQKNHFIQDKSQVIQNAEDGKIEIVTSRYQNRVRFFSDSNKQKSVHTIDMSHDVDTVYGNLDYLEEKRESIGRVPNQYTLEITPVADVSSVGVGSRTK